MQGAAEEVGYIVADAEGERAQALATDGGWVWMGVRAGTRVGVGGDVEGFCGLVYVVVDVEGGLRLLHCW